MDDIYWVHETPLREILDEQAPLKQKVPKSKPPPNMNSNYRKIIYKTRQARYAYNQIRQAKTGKLLPNGEI